MAGRSEFLSSPPTCVRCFSLPLIDSSSRRRVSLRVVRFFGFLLVSLWPSAPLDRISRPAAAARSIRSQRRTIPTHKQQQQHHSTRTHTHTQQQLVPPHGPHHPHRHSPAQPRPPPVRPPCLCCLCTARSTSSASSRPDRTTNRSYRRISTTRMERVRTTESSHMYWQRDAAAAVAGRICRFVRLAGRLTRTLLDSCVRLSRWQQKEGRHRQDPAQPGGVRFPDRGEQQWQWQSDSGAAGRATVCALWSAAHANRRCVSVSRFVIRSTK